MQLLRMLTFLVENRDCIWWTILTNDPINCRIEKQFFFMFRTQNSGRFTGSQYIDVLHKISLKSLIFYRVQFIIDYLLLISYNSMILSSLITLIWRITSPTHMLTIFYFYYSCKFIFHPFYSTLPILCSSH